MSKRNFILLIIVLVLAIVGIFIFLYLHKTPTTPPGEGENFWTNWNPFGNRKTTKPPTTPTETIPENPPETGTEAPIKLRKVSTIPIAGYGVFTKERYKEVPATAATPTTDGSQTSISTETPPITKTTKKPTPPTTEFISALRYMAQSTGNIYQTFADKIEERKFSDTLFPQVYDAYFGANAESVVARHLKKDNRTIETLSGSLPKEVLGADDTGTNKITGSFMTDGIDDITISPDLKSLFYLLDFDSGAVGIMSGVTGDKKIQVFDSTFSEWLSFWANNKTITLTTKPSSGIPGYMYAIDPAKKNINKIMGNVNGLTTMMSPDGKTVLYSNDRLLLYLYDIKTGTSTLLPVQTLPEKCVWDTKGEFIYCSVPKEIVSSLYPDSWYQGEVSFSDQIWQINVKNKTGVMLVDPEAVSGGEAIDGVKLALDKDGRYLFFVNKKDSYLWELDLK